MNLSVDLAPGHKLALVLRNPVMTASGTFGYGTEYARLIDIQRLGAIVTKATSIRARHGNPNPRMAETPSGILNTIGLQNRGVGYVVREMAPLWERWDVPVIVNVVGETIDDFVRVAERLEGVPGVAGLELNVSCPNVEGGMDFGRDPRGAAALVRGCRRVTDLPLIAKLTPNVTDVRPIAEAVAGAGANAVSLINTLLGMQIDVRARRPFLSTCTGGLSGPAIRPVAVRIAYEVAQMVEVPIVGVGGITCARDALEFIMAGASAIQVGTANFANPHASIEVLEGLQAFMESEGVDDINELIGAALPEGRRSTVPEIPEPAAATSAKA